MEDIKYDLFFRASLKNRNKKYTYLITDITSIQNILYPLSLEIRI